MPRRPDRQKNGLFFVSWNLVDSFPCTHHSFPARLTKIVQCRPVQLTPTCLFRIALITTTGEMLAMSMQHFANLTSPRQAVPHQRKFFKTDLWPSPDCTTAPYGRTSKAAFFTKQSHAKPYRSKSFRSGLKVGSKPPQEQSHQLQSPSY